MAIRCLRGGAAEGAHARISSVSGPFSCVSRRNFSKTTSKKKRGPRSEKSGDAGIEPPSVWGRGWGGEKKKLKFECGVGRKKGGPEYSLSGTPLSTGRRRRTHASVQSAGCFPDPAPRLKSILFERILFENRWFFDPRPWKNCFQKS